MTGREFSPISGAIALLRSTMITRGLTFLPKIWRSRAGISVAASMPVKPPPATTTVSRPFHGRTVRKAVQMLVEGNCIIERIRH